MFLVGFWTYWDWILSIIGKVISNCDCGSEILETLNMAFLTKLCDHVLLPIEVWTLLQHPPKSILEYIKVLF